MDPVHFSCDRTRFQPPYILGGGGKYPLPLFFNEPNTQEFNKSDKTTVYKLIILLCDGLFCDVFLGQMLFSSLFLSSSCSSRGKLVGLGKHTHALKLEPADRWSENCAREEIYDC